MVSPWATVEISSSNPSTARNRLAPSRSVTASVTWSKPSDMINRSAEHERDVDLTVVGGVARRGERASRDLRLRGEHPTSARSATGARRPPRASRAAATAAATAGTAAPVLEAVTAPHPPAPTAVGAHEVEVAGIGPRNGSGRVARRVLLHRATSAADATVAGVTPLGIGVVA